MLFRVNWKQPRKDEIKNTIWYPTIEDAVRMAQSISAGGDIVLMIQSKEEGIEQ